MKEGSRSGNPRGRVEKERGPFGCLIVKKKGGGTGSGGASRKEKGFESKVKKRPRLILNDSESSEDLLISRGRKLNAPDANVPLLIKNKISRSFKREEEIEVDRKLVLNDSESSEDLLISQGRKLNARNANVPLVVKNKISLSFKREEEIEVDRKRMRSEPVKCGEGTSIDRKRYAESEIGRKRSRVDTLNYPEDDEFDERMLKKEHLDDKGASMGRSSVRGSSVMLTSGNHREFETECSRSVKFHKREHFMFDRNSMFPVEQNHSRPGLKDKQKFDMRKDGSFCSVGPLREKFGSSSGQPVRVQGKNGVLKVMLNNKNKLGASEKNYVHKEAVDHKKASRFTDTSNWEAPHSPTLYSENNFHEKPHSVAVAEKNQVSSLKDLSENSESYDNKAEISDRSLLMESRSVATWGSKKEMKNKGKSSLTSEPNVSTRRKKGEVRRGSGTEKQLLREQIRHLLIDAGWTIDFRPRKNRNYQDAVYINQSGTEYWSIIKAYDALKKQYEDDLIGCKNRTSSSFTPIPEEVLSQLTRQTSKKIEREKTMKQKADREYKKAKTSNKKLQKKLVKVSMGRSVNGKEMGSFTMKDDKSLKFRIKGNTSIVLKTKKSINLSNDAGFREGECLLQAQYVSSGNLGKEMWRPSDANSLQGRKYKKQTGRALLVRGSNKGANSDDDDDFVPYTGKRTVLSWLIDMGAVPMSGKVQYMNKRRTRTMLEGWITKDGIHCGCCSKILTVSKFEIHAGSKLRQPFQYIFLENGVSLLQCHIDAWNRQLKPESCGFRLIDCDRDDPNDDTCAICGDGGKLICCDGCPSTFHQSCLDIQMLPVGDWHCPNCSCKFCRGIGGTTDQGEEITSSSLWTCSLCEEKYHRLCCKDMDDVPIDPTGSCMSFCGQSCKEIFQKLQKFLGVKQELDGGFSWTLVQRSNLDHDSFNHGLPQKAECNSKLAVALSVMDECFLPIIDRRSGINLINGVVYNCGSNFSRLNFSGFYTFVLERGDEIISAASIRIHGCKLAEMPFIGTRHIYRRQGMCRRLLNAIESALFSLNVEKLVIPAISDLIHTWTMVFDFKPLEESHKQEMRSMNLLVFPATGLLQKPLLTNNLARGSVSDCSVVRAIELKSNYDLVTENTSKSDIGSSDEPDIHGSDEGVIHHAQEINNEVAFTETSPHDPGVSACDNISNVIISHEHISHAPGKESTPDRNVVNDSNGINIEVTGVDPDLHSSESALQQMTIVNRKNSDASCGFSVQSTNGHFLHSNSDLDQHKVQEVEINSNEVCHFVSDIFVCEQNVPSAFAEITEQDSCGLKTEVFSVLPDKSICDKGCGDCTTGIIAQLQIAAPVNGSQGSGHYTLHHDSEGASQPRRIIDCSCEGSGKMLVHCRDSCMLQNIQESAFVDTHAVPESHRAEGEVAASGYNLQIRGKDPVESTSKNKGNHNINNVADDSGAAFTTDGSSLHVFDQERMLDTCDPDVGVAFVDPSQHMFVQASLSNSLDSAAESNFQGSHLNNRIRNPERLQKIPDLTSDLAHSVPSWENNYSIICCVEQNSQASVECNVHNMHNLQEVSGIEPGVISLGQDSINDASKVNKSMDTSESIFSTCSRECLV